MTMGFRRLWAGQTASVFGTAVSALAVPTIAIVGLRAPTFWIGVLEAAQYAAFPLFGLIAGVWVDRWSRRATMLVADVVRAIALASIPLAGAAHMLTFAQLVAVALLVGTASVFFDIAYQAYVPSLVAPAWLEHANARLEATSSVAQLAGSGLAGVLIALVGAPLAVACDAASYLVSVASLAGIRAGEAHRERTAPAERLPFAPALREGVAIVARSPVLRAILCATATVNFGGAIAAAVTLLFFYRVLHFSPALAGIILASGNVGFLGAFAAPSLGRRFGAGRLLGASLVGSIVATLAIPFALVAQPVAVLVGAQVLGAICIPLYNITQLSLRQRMVAPEQLGRMNATMRTAVWGTLPLGALLGGALGANIGIVPTILAGALVMTLAIPFVFAPAVRHVAAPQHEAA